MDAKSQKNISIIGSGCSSGQNNLVIFIVLSKSVTQHVLTLLLFAVIPLGTWCLELGLNLSFSWFTKEIILMHYCLGGCD